MPGISASAWEAMSPEERNAYVQRVRDNRAGSARGRGRGQGRGRGRGRSAGQASDTGESGRGTGTDRLPPDVWASMTQQERDEHIKRQKRERRKQRSSVNASGSSRNGGSAGTPRAEHDKKTKKKETNKQRRSRGRKKSEGSKNEVDPTKAWRFAQYDRVRCNLGESGWCSGNVQALDEPDPSGRHRSLPYVVMLDPPIKQLISVPQDSNVCVLPDVCFAA